MYEYNCIIKRVIDGDTVVVDVDLGFDIWIRDEVVRLHGINAPELRTSDLEEKKFGEYSKKYVENHLKIDQKCILVSKDFRSGKYGRCLGDFRIEDQMLTEMMLADHVAVLYREGLYAKEFMESDHADNRKALIEKGVTFDNV